MRLGRLGTQIEAKTDACIKDYQQRLWNESDSELADALQSKDTDAAQLRAALASVQVSVCRVSLCASVKNSPALQGIVPCKAQGI